jgi:HEAT repeat protein
LPNVKNLIDVCKHKMGNAGSDVQKIADLYREFVLELQKLPSPHEEILLVLQKIAKQPQLEDANFWLNAAQEHPALSYLDPLCAILSIGESSIWHEVIIQTLAELRNERAVPALEKALDYDFDTDAFNRIAVESLNALAKIGTDKAINLIKEASNSPIERVREEAILILEELNTK